VVGEEHLVLFGGVRKDGRGAVEGAEGAQVYESRGALQQQATRHDALQGHDQGHDACAGGVLAAARGWTGVRLAQPICVRETG
jgi:hypothetical protein